MIDLKKTLTSILPDLLTLSDKLIDLYNNSSFDKNTKEDGSNVTSADLYASETITDILTKHSPYPVISEENFKEIPDDTYWLIDPIDGTDSFIEKTSGEFCPMIALIKDKKPIFGLITFPYFSYYVYAINGEGAYLNKGGADIKLNCKENFNKEIKQCISKHRFTEKDKLFSKKIGVTKQQPISSCGLKFVSIAKKETDVYMNLSGLYMWDLGAPEIILKEAGGEIFDKSNRAFEYDLTTPKFTNGVFATNGDVKLRDGIKNTLLEDK
jgi:3'(2'), 5'-bisphosphate nucleotidase